MLNPYCTLLYMIIMVKSCLIPMLNHVKSLLYIINHYYTLLYIIILLYDG